MDDLPKKTIRRAKTLSVASEEPVLSAVADSHITSRRAVFRVRLRKWYIRILRLLIGTRRRQYTTLGVCILLIISLLIWHHAVSQPSSSELLAELQQVMIVPQEQPQIATVTNASVLRVQQPFYVNVQNGDVLFLFPTAGKAVLFRPSTHQVVNAGPVNVQSTSTKQ